MASKLCCGFQTLLGFSHCSNLGEVYTRQEEYAISKPIQCTEGNEVEHGLTQPTTTQPTKAPTNERSTGNDFQGKVLVQVSVAAGDKEVEVEVKAKIRSPETKNCVERLGKKVGVLN